MISIARPTLILAFACATFITSARVQQADVLKSNVTIEGINVGGLTKDEARKQLRLWWEGERRKEITLTSAKLKKQPDPRTATSWGIIMDDAKTLDMIPGTAYEGGQSASDSAMKFQAQLGFDETKLDSLERFISANLASPNVSSKATIVNGKFVWKKGSETKFNRAATRDAILAAYRGTLMGEIVLQESGDPFAGQEQSMSAEVMSSFSTSFPASKKDRNNNIAVASGKINGHVLMPGEKFSFNQVVGRRTVEAGYKEAPVFVNGRVDSGVGGGICQVSTTLYNSILLAGLKVVERRNHSLPVHYMAIGRDATVSYGTTDLQFQNPYDYPVAISRKLEKGKITITIFGKKPEYTYKIVSGQRKSWSNKTTYVIDRSLRPGRKVVRESGSPGYSIRTYRYVYQGETIVRKEDLGLSRYAGGTTVIAHNPTGSSSSKRRSPSVRGPVLPGASAPAAPKPTGPVVPQRRG